MLFLLNKNLLLFSICRTFSPNEQKINIITMTRLHQNYTTYQNFDIVAILNELLTLFTVYNIQPASCFEGDCCAQVNKRKDTF